MANADDQSTPGGRRGLIALLRRLVGQAAPEAEAPSLNGSELIEHAEAFQTLRVDDVMTPRANVVAVDIGTPFAELVAQFIESEHSGE